MMNRIDRLLQKLQGNKKLTIIGFVELDGDEWITSVHLWDGKPGSGYKTAAMRHATMDEAVAAAHVVVDEYPDAEALLYINNLVDDE